MVIFAVYMYTVADSSRELRQVLLLMGPGGLGCGGGGMGGGAIGGTALSAHTRTVIDWRPMD